jgi:hypothetical protein
MQLGSFQLAHSPKALCKLVCAAPSGDDADGLSSATSAASFVCPRALKECNVTVQTRMSRPLDKGERARIGVSQLRRFLEQLLQRRCFLNTPGNFKFSCSFSLAFLLLACPSRNAVTTRTPTASCCLSLDQPNEASHATGIWRMCLPSCRCWSASSAPPPPSCRRRRCVGSAVESDRWLGLQKKPQWRCCIPQLSISMHTLCS